MSTLPFRPAGRQDDGLPPASVAEACEALGLTDIYVERAGAFRDWLRAVATNNAAAMKKAQRQLRRLGVGVTLCNPGGSR